MASKPSSSGNCKRPRLQCPHCKEILSYSSYCRHQQTKVCVGAKETITPVKHSEVPDCNYSFEHTQQEPDNVDDNVIINEATNFISNLDETTSSSDYDDDDDDDENAKESAPEIWDLEESDLESEDNSTDKASDNLYYTLSYFFLFFQLCYHISDRALKHILMFVSSFLNWMSTAINVQGNGDNTTYIRLIKNFPMTIYSLKKKLGNESNFTRYCVCPSCHTMYKEKDCIVIGPNGTQVSRKCDYIEFPNHPQAAHRKKCTMELMKNIKANGQYKMIPKKIYIYNSIANTLQKLALRPGFFESCETWRKYNSAEADFMTDIYDGKIWREEWQKYLEVPGNLLLMLNVDWFRVYKHSSYSVGVIYLVIQNLPRKLRFKPENILIVGTIPGPREPKFTINTYLRPMVDELLDLWNGIQLESNKSSLGIRTIRVALALISSDIPATRKVCGFYGFNALHGCSKCMKQFPKSSFVDPPNFSGFQRDTWPARDLKIHHAKALEAKNARTNAAREKIQGELGIRYSELLRLPYLDIIRCHLIDPMHNLYLGTAKNVFSLWKANKILPEPLCATIQQKMDSIITPSHLGRLPGKIATAGGFSGFTAEQWMIWTIVYSPFALHEVLPPEHYEMWCLFSKSCSLLCRPFIHKTELATADELMIEFCIRFERIFGEACVTPNMHLHGHLRKCIEDVGPVYSFWCFSFERYNGILESFKKNWNAPEIQIIEKFSMMQTLNATDTSNIPTQFKSCLDTIKQNYVMLGDTSNILDSQTLFQYEKNLFSLPTEICATKFPFHKIALPLHEKIFSETTRDKLYNTYSKIYSAESVKHVPLRYEEFRQLEVFGQIYTSSKCRSHRSNTIMAIWPSITGNILDRSCRVEDVRVGIIEYLIQHVPSIAGMDDKSHIFAKVKWFEDHPRKNWFKHSIIVSCTLFSSETEASFLPVSRIMSRCARTEQMLRLDYGTDKVNICIPVTRRIDD